jgi:transposase
MPARRRAMRKILEVLRLRFESNLSHERISAATRISKGAVTNYLARAKTAGMVWPLAASVDEAQLEALLFPRAAPLVERRAAPDLAHIHQELKRKGVTLLLLWEEYAAAHAGAAYSYSQFCLLYRGFAASLKRSMRQVHRAGDKLFIDYAGPGMPIIDAASGEIHRAQIFVAVLGASSYTYAEASLTQQLPDWIASHVRCFEFMGGVAALLVPDNLKAAIKRACRYEPECTSTYEDLARHYGTAILPARPYKPRDKASTSYCTLCG